MLGDSSSSSSSAGSNSSGQSSSGNSGANSKKITEGYLHQISILRLLSQGVVSHGSGGSEARHFQIHEIADASGLKDERETQRYLYILEGQKLVSPHPAGDFTSRHWYITKEGFRALKTVASSGMA